MNESHLVYVLAKARENFGNIFSALTPRCELEGALHDAADSVGEETGETIEPLKSLSIHFFKGGLVVPCIDMAGSAVDKNPDDSLGFSHEVRLLGCQGVDRAEQALVLQERQKP